MRFGPRARAAALELVFAHLGCRAAKSWVRVDDHSSAAVSTGLGDEVVDRHEIHESGGRYEEVVYRIGQQDRIASEARRWYDPVVTGAGHLAAEFGGDV